MYEFQYECETTEQFNEALKVFARIGASKLELVIRNGPKPDGSPGGDKQTDWTFTVWNPEDWDNLNNRHHNNTFELGRSPVPAPRIDVYTHADGIIWKHVKVPAKVLVSDTRPGSIDPGFAGAGLVDMQVVDMSTGKGICESKITLTHNENAEAIHAVSDPEGKCRIAEIPNGYYVTVVEAPGYIPRRDSYDNRTPTYKQFTLPLSRQSKVAGIVTDVDGTPVKGVKIISREFVGIDGALYPALDDLQSVSDANGRFEITGVPIGFCNLRCFDKQWHLTDSIFEWYPVPGDVVKIVVESTATIRAKITTTDGTAPEGTINMSIEPAEGEHIGRWGYGGNIPENGKFEIKGIPPDEYAITVNSNPSPGKYQADGRVMKIEGGRTYTLDIVLKKRE
ncbi:MAG: carboxypeptidase regulatory-like domain-containing protein [Phycisphaerales bacterium]|nr:MAG: carboxypeptidase regulatory-like domain-containing protein [Phycisphaerales bacterium]